MRVEPWHVQALQLYLRAMTLPRKARLNQAGYEGILFQLAERPLERHERDSLKKILQVRNTFRQSDRVIEVRDFGVGGENAKSSGPNNRSRSIRSIHSSSAVPHWWGIFLFRLVRFLNPSLVLELGSNLGVSAAYIQSALDINDSGGTMTTIEGDPSLAEIAEETIGSISNSPKKVVCGRFQDVLPEVLERHTLLDLVFIDGHHAFEPTLEYFSRIKPFLSPRGVVVFDDIYLWSRPVRRAWKEIVRRNTSMIPLDLAKFGLLFTPSKPLGNGE